MILSGLRKFVRDLADPALYVGACDYCPHTFGSKDRHLVRRAVVMHFKDAHANHLISGSEVES